jgi:hypothetical protein
MKKFLILLLIGGFLLTGSLAYGFTLGGYLGGVKFKFNNYDFGTLYVPPVNNPPNGGWSGLTDSYGIFSITNITNLGFTNLWVQTPGEALEGWFYGLSDDGQVLDGTGSGNIWTMGGILEVYLGVNNLDATAGPGVAPVLPNPPADIWNVTDGALFLSAIFVPGITGDPTTTYLQDITSITVPISGSGSGYLAVTGGSHAWMFDSNTFLGGAADLYLETDFRSGTIGDPDYGWTVVSHDPVLGSAVPEPATMLLLGSGLIGVAGFARRRFKK